MNGSEEVRERAKRRKAELQAQLEMMETGRLQPWKKRDRDGPVEYTTAEAIASVRSEIAQCERIIEGGRP
ncbi:MAG: hypothetical protein ICV73_05495 [Acetobacteraceae bacterium]|nr:hypothetical protein [Acetobacteraceae bacterium]